MIYSNEEIFETVRMIHAQNLDIRTVTLGINLRGCVSADLAEMREKIFTTIIQRALHLVQETKAVEAKFGIPIVNKRIAVTPIGSLLDAPLAGMNAEKAIKGAVSIARTLDSAAKKLGIDYIGGYSALVHKGLSVGEGILIHSLPRALTSTERVCSAVNVATSKSGINMDAILLMGQVIKKTAVINPLGCARLVVFVNAPSDNPFMAGAFHGEGEPETVINVGISGPGVVRAVLSRMDNADLGELAETIKRTAFKITRMGELVGREMAERLKVKFGIVDLSLAPTPVRGDSVANILEIMGLERCGTHGTTAALAMLTDAVKKGGAMATSYTGGLSGAFIPVSEDAGMVEALKAGAINIDKLEAMTSVSSVGLDMIVIPADTPSETISAIIADECAIGMVNNKATGVRVIPAGKAGEIVEFGGLLGRSPVMPVNRFSAAKFVCRGGRIPAPIQSFRN
jgi:uncharacterized protein